MLCMPLIFLSNFLCFLATPTKPVVSFLALTIAEREREGGKEGERGRVSEREKCVDVDVQVTRVASVDHDGGSANHRHQLLLQQPQLLGLLALQRALLWRALRDEALRIPEPGEPRYSFFPVFFVSSKYFRPTRSESTPPCVSVSNRRSSWCNKK